MGAINIIIGVVTLVFFLLVFLQPVMILLDTATSTFDEKNTTKYGTDADGNIVEVGDSIWGADLVLGLIGAIGFAFFLGFIIWASKGGRDPYDDGVMRGGYGQ